VNQRKGKVITLFDVKLSLEYEGGCTGPVTIYA
jgi:activator of HSP90 ATPase